MGQFLNVTRQTPSWLRLILGLVCCVVLNLSVSDGADQGGKDIVEEIGTAAGVFQIVRVDAMHYHLVLSSRVVMDVPEQYSVRLTAQFPTQGPPHLLVLFFDSGGVACPGQFRILDLRDGNNVRISLLIGNCSDVPELSYNNDSLVLAFPLFRYAKGETWTYADGQLRRQGPTGRKP